jgi:hypothetical protein
MITRPTTFILGAGCSLEFGFPTGFELVRQLSLQDASGGLGQPLSQLISLGYEQNSVRDFSIALSHSGRESVDAFLEHRPDFREIGKAAIAMALIPRESQDSLFRPSHGKESLYQYIWKQMNTSRRDFTKNCVEFITFNYDRSLEEYLSISLTNAYGLAHYETRDIVSELSVNHVHGSLGNHPAFSSSATRGYQSDTTASEVRLAASQIKIIHEDITATPEFDRARDSLKRAEVIVFLGFGYDGMNLRRLGVEQFPISASVFGTAYGLTKLERSAVQAKFPGPVTFGGSIETSLDFLRQRVQLTDSSAIG